MTGRAPDSEILGSSLGPVGNSLHNLSQTSFPIIPQTFLSMKPHRQDQYINLVKAQLLGEVSIA